MKTSQAGNSILPNTFQHPNIFIDRLMYYLTPEENTVLTFAVRRILGFQENISSRRDHISLSQFVEGIRSRKDNASLSNGCGLKKAGVKTALANLEKFNILIPTTEIPDPRKGQEYWLQENELSIDWDALEQRKTETEDKARLQTLKARCSVRQNTSVEQNSSDTVEQKARVLSDRNTKPRETQGNPQREEEVVNPLFSLFMNNVSMVTPIIANALEKAERDYGLEWVKESIQIAGRNGAKSWNYCEKVLERWRREGKSDKPSPNGKKSVENRQKYVTGEFSEFVEC